MSDFALRCQELFDDNIVNMSCDFRGDDFRGEGAFRLSEQDMSAMVKS
jgi:hypothetical protein